MKPPDAQKKAVQVKKPGIQSLNLSPRGTFVVKIGLFYRIVKCDNRTEYEAVDSKFEPGFKRAEQAVFELGAITRINTGKGQ
jgi:hypothetical protein